MKAQMKTLLTLVTGALGLLVFSTTVHAQSIVWGSAQDMAGDTDVIVPTGSLIDAATFFGSAVTVNSVTFNPLTSNGGSYSDASGNISITTPSGGAGPYTTAFSTSSPSSTNYSNLTSVIGYTVGNTGQVTLSGLTNGNTYQVEVWSYWTSTATGGSTTFTGTTPVNLLSTNGQYALGTFTASGTTETFGYAVNASDNHAVINAVTVFETSGSPSVPEPSTYALLGLGVFALIMLQKRKSQV